MRNWCFIFLLWSGLAQAQAPLPVLPKDDFITVRDGLPHFYQSLHTTHKATIGFVGGSITYNPGWRNKLCAWLQQQYPQVQFTFVTAAIPSLGSVAHVFRLQNDLLSTTRPDLVLVEAAVNDRGNGTDSITQIRALDGIVRQIKQQNKFTDVVLMSFADPDKTNDYHHHKTPVEIANHEAVAAHYHLPSVNLGKEVHDRIQHHELDWDRDIKDIHPSEYGQQLYFQTIQHLLQVCLGKQPARTMATIPAAMNKASFEAGYYYDITRAQTDNNWTLDKDWTPTDGLSTREGFVHVPMLTSATPGATLQLPFQGTAAGIAVTAGADAGTITYSIDNGPPQTLDLYTVHSSWLHLPSYYLLAGNLTNGKHVLHITISQQTNTKSKGHACRIVHFLVNGPQLTKSITDFVNPFIGTGAAGSGLSGNTFPGATVPFGMVQLSPDTRDVPDWGTASGYDYNDKTIAGFSHTHLSGTGVAELFDVLLMPITGPTSTEPGDASQPGSGYRSTFSHQQETARPGYYQVKLLQYNINAELTATTHAAFHRYTYPANSNSHVVIDLNHSLNKNSWNTRIIQSQLKLVNARTIEGYRIITGWAKLRKVYFHIEFSRPVTQHLFVDGNTTYYNNAVINGSNVRAILDFDTPANSPLLVKVGLSSVSIANAQQNLQHEIAHWNFDQTTTQAKQLWQQELQKVAVEGTDKQKEIFYTALYHTFLQPNTLSDVNGSFMAANYTQQHTTGTHYSTFSLWDTYRAAHPLYTLLQPQRSAQFVKSMLSQYTTYGYLPVWQLWGQENYCMIGNHAIPVITDAVLKGIPGIDIQQAYEAVKNSSLIAHPNSPFAIWERYGYMPENIQTQSVSITLEMAYDDWCVAQLAKKLGKTADYQRFLHRSQYYQNLYNHQTHFFQSKDDKGNWMAPFDPLKYGSNGGNPFTEGNAWQYYWYVPHDVPQLITLTGGNQAFISKLDSFFTLSHNTEEINNNASGFIGQYAHGNEPSHHVAYLYNYAGQPWKTQYYVQKIMRELYNNGSSGYAGNDDCGEMSAWYVFSALGFYPVNPANGVYAIGSPLLAHAKLQLPGGKTFTIRTHTSSDNDIYIQSATLNGKPYTHTYIRHSDIMQGGTLEFTLGPQPATSWGVLPDDKPIHNSF
ncbi:alpha-1,2-mannosidase, putative [Filimonas lacunae]|uniref:Alpha-1,2-mannosidase, putative n=1 Tax=Filimonas lacunae TaxID=477680 RepID=A0A173MJX6_9BACT|nr:GH92 family glycosyl hydrolase [Filimonas lacunae]BAV07942.1 alpha-1,2-mannosidase [Filimonas lacunae]SIT06965.1 alpha-1,2-mannosidase, putative [Filimonas lacunae]